MTAHDPFGGPLPFRNAIADHDHVASTLVSRGEDGEKPLVTIAITTFKRYDLILESMRSALDQTFDRAYEIIVLDNDPGSGGAALLTQALPELLTRNFRYFVNAENIGVFGNFNRCIRLARGEWLTILNDDDLLDSGFLASMFADIDRDPVIDGLICDKVYFGGLEDETEGKEPVFDSKMSFSVLLSLVTSVRGIHVLSKRLIYRVISEIGFRGGTTRTISAKKFFWGTILGNGAGFLFRKDMALKIGGFYPEEYPSADFGNFVRFSIVGCLKHRRGVLARVRRTEGNITVNTIREQLQQGYKIQTALTRGIVPAWRRKLLPMMIAHDLADYNNNLGTSVTSDEIEQYMHIKLPRDKPRLHRFLRVVLGGT